MHLWLHILSDKDASPDVKTINSFHREWTDAARCFLLRRPDSCFQRRSHTRNLMCDWRAVIRPWEEGSERAVESNSCIFFPDKMTSWCKIYGMLDLWGGGVQDGMDVITTKMTCLFFIRTFSLDSHTLTVYLFKHFYVIEVVKWGNCICKDSGKRFVVVRQHSLFVISSHNRQMIRWTWKPACFEHVNTRNTVSLFNEDGTWHK